MNESESLREYSKRFIYDGYQLNDWELDKIRKSYGFQKYLLYIAIKELKTEIRNALPKCLRWLLNE